MNVTSIYPKFIRWLGLAFVALAVNQVARAQLAPIWTVTYGQAAPVGMARGNYYSRPDLNGLVLFADTPTINFDWGFGAPAAGVPINQFSVRWTGKTRPGRACATTHGSTKSRR